MQKFGMNGTESTCMGESPLYFARPAGGEQCSLRPEDPEIACKGLKKGLRRTAKCPLTVPFWGLL